MVRGRQAGVVRDFQSTPTVQQKLGTVGGADSSRASGAPTPHTPRTHTNIPASRTKVPRVERYMYMGVGDRNTSKRRGSRVRRQENREIESMKTEEEDGDGKM